jgi:hypothetical protein
MRNKPRRENPQLPQLRDMEVSLTQIVACFAEILVPLRDFCVLRRNEFSHEHAIELFR